MKKIILSGLILATIGITIIGCNKEEVEIVDSTNTNVMIHTENEKSLDINNYSNISILNEVLTFRTFDSYTDIIDSDDENRVDFLIEHVNNLNFNSFSKVHPNSDLLERDELLESILDENMIIKIDEWFIKINILDETVTAVSETEINAYEDLLSGQNRNIKIFSTGDDVIDHLQNNTSPDDRSCGGIGGGTYPSYSAPYNGQIIKTFSNGVVWRLNPYVHFFRAGIWFRLSSQYEVHRYPTSSSTSGGQVVSNITSENITIEMFIRSPKAWWKRRPCNSSSIGTKNSGFHYSDSVHGHGKKTIYGGIRNLNGYYLYVQGRARYSNGTVTTASPYGGRNINSPY